MSLSMASLLAFEEDVPATVRAALREAAVAPAPLRTQYLELAARYLYRDADLDCDDARELVGL